MPPFCKACLPVGRGGEEGFGLISNLVRFTKRSGRPVNHRFSVSLKKISLNRVLDHKKTMIPIPWKKKNRRESSQAFLLRRQGRLKTPHLH
jgi:hypothetical protein